MKNKRNTAFIKSSYVPNLRWTMRITGILFLVLFLQAKATVFSQKSVVSLDLENVALGKVFTSIEKQTGYNFLYNNKHVNLDRKVSVYAEKDNIRKVLYKLLNNTGLEYVILDRQIILKLNRKQTQTTSAPVVSKEEKEEEAQLKVTGTVTDQDGIPLGGVTVLVKGTQRGVATDFDGNFEIEAVVGETLVLSYIGFVTAEVPVDGATNIVIQMTPTSFQLGEVDLVSTGYTKIAKERATGSFASINEQLLDQKAAATAIEKLNGEVTGVLFNPGDTESPIIIRGLSTINSNQSPLIVVDGFPIEGDFSSINPAEVKSIQVLKDAAAASIWGIRATNGVIVVVTKKGNKSGKPKFDFSINHFYSPKPNLFKNKLASPASQIEYARAIVDNELTFLGDSGIYEPGDPFLNAANTGQLSPVALILTDLAKGNITNAEAEAQFEALKQIDVRNEFSRLFLRPQLNSQYNLVISGGGEKNDYRASILYNRQEGQFINESSDQILANINQQIQLSDKLSLRTNFNASFGKQNLAPDDTFDNNFFTLAENGNGNRAIVGLPDAESFIRNNPISGTILNPDGSYVPMLGGAAPSVSEFLMGRGFKPFTYNLKQEFDENNHTFKDVELRLQTALTYQISEGLSLEGRYQLESSWGRGENILNENRYMNRATFNYFTEFDSTDGLENLTITQTNLPEGSIAYFTENNLTAHTFRAQLNFDRSFSDDKHRVNALAGYEARKIINEARGAIRYGFNEQALTYINPDFVTAFPQPLYFSGSLGVAPDPSRYQFIENRFLSYYGNFAYTYLDRYTLTGSTRLDDTNLFGQSDDFSNVPLYSVGLKWNAHRENWFSPEWINQFALRASYGTNGNVNLSTSPFLQASLANSFNPNTPNLPYGFIQTVPNPTLRLERTRTINFGADIELFNGRISTNIDVYRKTSEDLLVNQLLNATVGVSESLLNVGQLRNQGIDVGLSIDAIKTDNFQYSTRFNYSFNDNEVTELNNDPGENISGLIFGSFPQLGQPLSTIHSYVFAGLDRNGYAQFFNENGDIEGFNTEILSPDALKVEGTTIAPYYGSWMNNFSYKGWSLRTLVQYQAGHVFRFDDVFSPDGFAEGGTFEDFDRRWQQPGDEVLTTVPALFTFADLESAPANTQQYLTSDLFVDSATNIVLQEVILNYNFNKETLSKLGLSNLSLSLQGNNLKVWNFNKWNVDPNNSFIPLIPQYTLGIRTSF